MQQEIMSPRKHWVTVKQNSLLRLAENQPTEISFGQKLTLGILALGWDRIWFQWDPRSLVLQPGARPLRLLQGLVYLRLLVVVVEHRHHAASQEAVARLAGDLGHQHCKGRRIPLSGFHSRGRGLSLQVSAEP